MNIFLYGMDIYEEFDGLYGYKRYYDKKLNILLLRRLARRYVDGAIAMSTFAADFIRSILESETLIRVSHPYIQPDMYDRLARVEPDLSPNNAVFVGGRLNGCKGIDLLTEAWESVREQFPDAELTVVGPGHREHHDPSPGIEFTGFVAPEDLPGIFESKSLYVHPARVDTFPISVVEAMHAGLPAVVTRTTGTRSVVENVDRSMITDADPDAIARRIVEYFSLDISERRDLSRRARQETTSFDATSKKCEFEEAFDSVMNEIGTGPIHSGRQ
jgi:glycosyltransferase involved in cell wall biosynthesis